MRLGRLGAMSIGVASVAGALTQRAYAACDLSGGVQAGANCAKGDLTGATLSSQIGNITNLLILVVGITSVIMVVIGGLRYVLSGGDSKGTTSAKDTILYAVIGVAVAVLAYSIVNFVIGKF